MILIDHLPNSNMGPLMSIAFLDQFHYLRDGDRFWYEREGQFTPGELAEIYGTSLSDIIKRNFDIKNLPENPFFVRERQLNAKGKNIKKYEYW